MAGKSSTKPTQGAIVKPVIAQPACTDCKRQDVVLIYHPMLRHAYCLPCMRDNHQKFWHAVRHWVVKDGNIRNGQVPPEAK